MALFSGRAGGIPMPEWPVTGVTDGAGQARHPAYERAPDARQAHIESMSLTRFYCGSGGKITTNVGNAFQRPRKAGLAHCDDPRKTSLAGGRAKNKNLPRPQTSQGFVFIYPDFARMLPLI